MRKENWHNNIFFITRTNLHNKSWVMLIILATMESISGEWYGHYRYGEGYDKALTEKSFLFTLTLKDLGEDQFEGICTDEGDIEHGQHPAVIKGFIEDNFISFTKEISDTPELQYEGNYNSASASFSGIWERYGNQ